MWLMTDFFSRTVRRTVPEYPVKGILIEGEEAALTFCGLQGLAISHVPSFMRPINRFRAPLLCDIEGMKPHKRSWLVTLVCRPKILLRRTLVLLDAGNPSGRATYIGGSRISSPFVIPLDLNLEFSLCKPCCCVHACKARWKVVPSPYHAKNI